MIHVRPMKKVICTTPTMSLPATLPHPEHVRQGMFHNTCYILVSLQAIAARHPDHLTAMLTPSPGGVRVRHYGLSAPIPLDILNGPRFTLAAPYPAGHTQVPLRAEMAAQGWYGVLERAYRSVAGVGVRRHGHPEAVLFWALGCRVQTDSLPRDATRAKKLAALAQMFVAGECVVFLVNSHCWSLVGATMCVPCDTSAWHLTLSDPRGWRRTFTVVSNAPRAMQSVYAYSVTMGAGGTR